MVRELSPNEEAEMRAGVIKLRNTSTKERKGAHGDTYEVEKTSADVRNTANRIEERINAPGEIKNLKEEIKIKNERRQQLRKDWEETSKELNALKTLQATPKPAGQRSSAGSTETELADLRERLASNKKTRSIFGSIGSIFREPKAERSLKEQIAALEENLSATQISIMKTENASSQVGSLTRRLERISDEITSIDHSLEQYDRQLSRAEGSLR